MKAQVGKVSLPFLALLPTLIQALNVVTPNGVEDLNIPADAKALDVFRTHHAVKPDLFEADKSHRHSSLVFTYMETDEQYKSFITWIMGHPNFPARPTPPSKISDTVANARVRAISARDVAACQTRECCDAISYLINVLPGESLKGLTQRCIQRLVRYARDGRPGYSVRSVLSRIPDVVQKEQGDLILYELGAGATDLEATHLQRLISTPQACSRLNTEAWVAILRRDHLAKVITPECVRDGAKTFSAIREPHLLIGAMGPLAFIHYNLPLSRHVVSRMSAEQLANFAREAEDGQFPGHGLKFEHIGSANAKGLNLRLILGFLYKDRKNNNLRLQQSAWREVPKDIFSKLAIDDLTTLAPAISAERDDDPSYNGATSIQAFMNETQLNDLFKYPAMCAVIEPIVMKKKLPLTRECFLAMAPDTQAAALRLGVPLPDNALDSITAERVKLWSYGEENGLEVLNSGGGRPNQAALIANMGSKVQYDHPCRAIDSVDILKKVILLQLHMSSTCYNNMSLKLEPEDLATLKPRMAFLIPFKKLKEKQPKEFWSKMTPAKLLEVMSNEEFCSEVDVDTMIAIDRKAYSAITPKCYQGLRAIVDQLPTEAIQALPPGVFAGETSETISVSVISKLTPEQLSMLGASVGDHQHPATLFTLDMLNAFGGDRLSKLSAQQWKHTRAEVFGTFSSAERLHAVDPHRMAFWSVSQVKIIPEPVILSLKAAQAEAIGKGYDASQSPIGYLARLPFPDELQQVLKRRLDEMPAPPELGTLTIVVIVVGSIVVVGGIVAGIYFLMRRD